MSADDLQQRPESDDWVNLVALPSKGWGSVSVKKLHAVVTALGVDPAETDISILFDDLGMTWYVVMCPPDAIPEEVTLARLVELGEAERRARQVGSPKPVDPPETRQVEPPAEAETPAPALPPPPEPEPAPPSTSRVCAECGREFASPSQAREHEKLLHADDAIPLVCPDCGWVFDTETGLGHHRVMKHATEEAPKTWPRKERRITLACSEPACHYTAEYAADMNSHTVASHGRRATREERTPVTAEGPS